MDIPVHLSSDAHHPDNITKGFMHAAMLLEKVGYETCQVLQEGIWQPIKLRKRAVYSV